MVIYYAQDRLEVMSQSKRAIFPVALLAFIRGTIIEGNNKMVYRNIFNLQDVKKFVESRGFFLLECYSKNKRKFVLLMDEDGYRYAIDFGELRRGANPEFVAKTNPFSLENISLWLNKNDKPFKITENNIYLSAKTKLEVECLVCGYMFYMGWDSLKSGRGCPSCSGKVVSNKNRIFTIYPELILDWHPTKNKGINPESVSFGSKIDIWWKCNICGYEWKTEAKRRGSEKSGCPACSNEVLTNKNRFSTIFPKIAEEWNYEKNKNLFPSDFARCSDKKFWWKCKKCGYEWVASIGNRTNIGSGCPSCAGQIVSDRNRFSVLFPELLDEWDFSRNEIRPSDVSFGTHKKVWWICSICGNNWLAAISGRSRGIGCPNCKESKGEKRISRFLINNEIKHIREYRFSDCKNILPLPFDFYMPSENLCIEYNGKQHYMEVSNDFFGKNKKEIFAKRKKLDKIKFDYCKNSGINLLIIPYWNFENIEEILRKEFFE